MVKGDLWHEIHRRFRLKEKKRAIVRSPGLDVQTVRKILKQREPVSYHRSPPEETLLAPHREWVRQRLPAVGWCAQSVFEELRAAGYAGSYDTVRRFVQPLRDEAHREAAVRFETSPGRQGQVDWGQCWSTIAGRSVKVHLFVMTLGYSRRLFARATLDEKLPTLICCHEEAFEHFGGITHEYLYDNPKTVVLSRNFEGSRIGVESRLLGLQILPGLPAEALPALPGPDQGQGRIGRQVRQALPAGQGLRHVGSSQ